LKAGAIIKYGATALRIITDQRGDRATGVEYVDEKGVKTTIQTSAVVLAAFTAMNSKLLLNSANEAHKQGLANSSGLVGRFIMSHCLANVAALFDEDTQNYMGVPGGLAISQDDYKKDGRSGAFGSLTWVLGVAQKPNDVAGLAGSRADLFGPALEVFMKQASRGLAKIQAMVEELPDRDNRVVLDDSKDAFGMPNARLVHHFGPDALRLFEHANGIGEKIWKQTNALTSWHNPHPAMAHMAGGTIMGQDPSSSVTDEFGRTHDVSNLFIAGGSLFPTEAAVPPTFTIYALANRTASRIQAHWGSVVK
jgi:choline dehydrogenase-like flavoprotein